MALMKKDMAGAAHVIGLAKLVIAHMLPVHLRVLIPAVDNAVSGSAMRPVDIIKTRSGKTVEITNTDAEGRLILADALFTACAKKPDLIIDMATLTGAARIALGVEVPALFCNNDKVAEDLYAQSMLQQDPLWRLPLYQPYGDLLNSQVADLVNSAVSSYAGAIIGALFLQEFVDNNIDWIHLDLMAWNVTSKPGRPEGGEAQAIRAVFAYLQQRYAA